VLASFLRIVSNGTIFDPPTPMDAAIGLSAIHTWDNRNYREPLPIVSHLSVKAELRSGM